MDKKIALSLSEELIIELIKEAEGHRETFEELVLRKLKNWDSGYHAPDDFFQKKIVKISIEDLTSDSMKQEEFDNLLTNVLEDYFSKPFEERNKTAEESLTLIRDGKKKKEEKTVNNKEEENLEFNIPDSVWDEIFNDRKTKEEIIRDIEELKREERNNDLDDK